MKGQAMSISEMILGLLTIGLVLILVGVYYGKYFDIHTMMLENEAERHAINLANVLMSSDKIAYYDGYMVHRGVFDKSKLDNILVKRMDMSNTNLEDKLSPNEHFADIGYPDTNTIVTIVDLESDEGWLLSLYGPTTKEGQTSSRLISCLSQHMKIDIGSIFRPSLLLAPWDIWDLAKCTVAYVTSAKTSTEGFPIVIRTSNGETHLGRIVVRIMEL